ncbi:flippase [Methanobrevibacter sp. UBA313]|uniref:flippase n=1 Tax=Methanobrevibacter sp. UBA313 TaxID=1915477 RepID=UPI0039B9504F
MNEVKNLFKNSSWMMLSQIITGLLSFFWTIITARYLGSSDFGIMSFAMSFAGIIIILMDLGITTYATRNMSRDNSSIKEYYGNLIPLKILLNIFVIILSLLILILMGKSNLTIIVSLIFVFEYALMSLSGLVQGGFQAVGKMEYQAKGIIINSFIILTFIIITCYFNLGLIFLASAYCFAYAIMLIYLIVNSRKYITIPKYNINLKFCKKAIKLSIPFALTSLFTTIYFSIDIVMLSIISGNSATGIYNASYKIITVLTTFFPVYQTVVFPLMSKLFEGSKDLLKLSYIKSVKYLLLIIMPITFGIVLYATPLVTLIYGKGYLNSGPVMQVLVWTVSFLFVNGAASTLLNASNKEVSVTKIYCIAAITNVILNLILIPIYSYHGAAIATVASEILICFLMIHIIKDTSYCPDKSIFKDIIKIILASVLMFIVLKYTGLNMWLGIIVGIIIYSVCILCLKTLDNEDKSLIHDIIK